jgi:hypothetical protein
MEIPPMAVTQGTDAARLGTNTKMDIVEFALLLPANRAEALIALSRKRQESVGQILRDWIDRALASEQ